MLGYKFNCPRNISSVLALFIVIIYSRKDWYDIVTQFLENEQAKLSFLETHVFAEVVILNIWCAYCSNIQHYSHVKIHLSRFGFEGSRR